MGLAGDPGESSGRSVGQNGNRRHGVGGRGEATEGAERADNRAIRWPMVASAIGFAATVVVMMPGEQGQQAPANVVLAGGPFVMLRPERVGEVEGEVDWNASVEAQRYYAEPSSPGSVSQLAQWYQAMPRRSDITRP